LLNDGIDKLSFGASKFFFISFPQRRVLRKIFYFKEIMKTKLTLFSFSLVLLASCRSEFDIPVEDVPQAVMTSFQQKYPSVQPTGWEVEKTDGRLVYEAKFTADGKKKESEFRLDGTFVKEE
jgi:hypothetical protein